MDSVYYSSKLDRFIIVTSIENVVCYTMDDYDEWESTYWMFKHNLRRLFEYIGEL